MRRLWSIFTSLVLIAAGSLGSAAADTDSVKRAIEHDLQEEAITGVNVGVDDGTVTLTGEVDSLWARERAAELAVDHREVQSVVNELTLGSGPGDDPSDGEVSREVADRLSRYVHYSIFDDVNVAVRNNVVTLTGKVTWGYKAKEMEKMAARVPGVERVVNEIEVLPTSSQDEQIRNSLASRMYGDPLFVRYSTQFAPPVHIIVEDGHVTLTGQVDSEIQRRKAEIIARDTFGVFSVDNAIEVSSS
jgi:osmotically-inducible protein OsmY